MEEQEKSGKFSQGKKSLLIALAIFALVILWFGSCFAIGMLSMNFVLGIVLASVLCIWLFIQLLDYLKKR